MQLFANLVLLAHQLSLTSGLRVIDNGLGLAVYGSEERIVDYALLASDQKSALPSQVHEMLIVGCPKNFSFKFRFALRTA